MLRHRRTNSTHTTNISSREACSLASHNSILVRTTRNNNSNIDTNGSHSTNNTNTPKQPPAAHEDDNDSVHTTETEALSHTSKEDAALQPRQESTHLHRSLLEARKLLCRIKITTKTTSGHHNSNHNSTNHNSSNGNSNSNHSSSPIGRNNNSVSPSSAAAKEPRHPDSSTQQRQYPNSNNHNHNHSHTHAAASPSSPVPVPAHVAIAHLKQTSRTHLQEAAVNQLMQTIQSSTEARRLLTQLRHLQQQEPQQQPPQDDTKSPLQQQPHSNPPPRDRYATPNSFNKEEDGGYTALTGLERSMRALAEARREIVKIQESQGLSPPIQHVVGNQPPHDKDDFDDGNQPPHDKDDFDDDDDDELLPIIPHPQSPQASVLRRQQMVVAAQKKKQELTEETIRKDNHPYSDYISELGDSSSAVSIPSQSPAHDSNRQASSRYMPQHDPTIGNNKSKPTTKSKSSTPLLDIQRLQDVEKWVLSCDTVAMVADALDGCTPADGRYDDDEEDLLYDSELEDDYYDSESDTSRLQPQRRRGGNDDNDDDDSVMLAQYGTAMLNLTSWGTTTTRSAVGQDSHPRRDPQRAKSRSSKKYSSRLKSHNRTNRQQNSMKKKKTKKRSETRAAF